VDDRAIGPILLNQRGNRMDRHAATRRLRHLAAASGVRIAKMHPHMLRHTYVTTMLDAGVPLRVRSVMSPGVITQAAHGQSSTTSGNPKANSYEPQRNNAIEDLH
jgi:integrase